MKVTRRKNRDMEKYNNTKKEGEDILVGDAVFDKQQHDSNGQL